MQPLCQNLTKCASDQGIYTKQCPNRYNTRIYKNFEYVHCSSSSSTAAEYAIGLFSKGQVTDKRRRDVIAVN